MLFMYLITHLNSHLCDRNPSEKKIQSNMCFYMQMSFDVNRLQNILKCLLHQSNNLKEQVTLI